ncbi:hypothetical protein [Streptomyces sp. NPDC088270]|uniref:hypothetical protein n=1 Tax=unclassified Streptomyces TaxID=2593676 RepID=UPI003443D18C
MTITQHDSPTEATNIPALLALCVAAVSTRHEQIREQDRQSDADAVRYAEQAAVATFGETAAAALGTWLPAPMMDEDCLQANVTITPGAYLTYTAHCEGDVWFTLLTSCTRCGTSSETRIGNLLGLADALHRAGVR